MSLEELTRGVFGYTERRKLLRRVGQLGAAATVSVLTRSGSSHAAGPEVDVFTYHGCGLCKTPAAQGGPACPSLKCVWCWWGDCHGNTGNRHQNLCCEGHSATGGGQCCSPACNGVVCSFLGEYARKCQGYQEVEPNRCS